MGRTKKTVARVTTVNTASEPEIKDPFNTNLADEAQGLEEAKKKFKMQEVDGFTQFIQTLFKLDAAPLFKRDFTDPRWPRNEVGENLQVERVYLFAMKGPRPEFLGFRSLGDDEINGDGKIIVDRLSLKGPEGSKKRVEDKIILAKKWTAEQSGYRYFWIHEDEEFEDEEAEKVFLERFAKLEKKPEFTFGNVRMHPGVVGNDDLRFY